jgi:hypothetical protein
VGAGRKAKRRARASKTGINLFQIVMRYRHNFRFPARVGAISASLKFNIEPLQFKVVSCSGKLPDG